ncbi:MAG: hypothetical protein JWQ75_669 [Pseudarthrobacter sp.]|nr:hypothetical protein [Pseudarthrobacter sp.]
MLSSLNPAGMSAAGSLLPHPGPPDDGMERWAKREDALQQAPGVPVVLLRPAPVRVRSILAKAIAYTVTDVLVEWDGDDGYCVRWQASWLVRRLT